MSDISGLRDWMKAAGIADPGLHLYVLDAQRQPVAVDAADPDTPQGREAVLTWGQWMHEHGADQRVALDRDERWWVSTKFMGYDMRLLVLDDGPPLVFETMAFVSTSDPRLQKIVEQRRYATWDEAVAGHAEVLAAMRAATT